MLYRIQGFKDSKILLTLLKINNFQYIQQISRNNNTTTIATSTTLYKIDTIVSEVAWRLAISANNAIFFTEPTRFQLDVELSVSLCLYISCINLQHAAVLFSGHFNANKYRNFS